MSQLPAREEWKRIQDRLDSRLEEVHRSIAEEQCDLQKKAEALGRQRPAPTVQQSEEPVAVSLEERQRLTSDAEVRADKTPQVTESPTSVTGVVLFIVGLLAFVASAIVGGGGGIAGPILAGLLNPLFFVGVPLDIHLILKARRTANAWRPSSLTSRQRDERLDRHKEDAGRPIEFPPAFVRMKYVC